MLLSRRMLTALFVLCFGGSVVHAQALDDINPFGDDTAESQTGDNLLGDTPPAEQPAASQPRTVEDVTKQADALAAEGKCAQAIEIYSQVLLANQAYAPAHLGRGKCLAELGESQLALQSLAEAVNYGPRYPGLYPIATAERGKILLDQGQFQEAVDDFGAAVQSSPANPEYLYLRGKALMKLAALPQAGFGQTDYVGQAISSLKRAIELDENYAEAYLERGMAYAASGSFDKSIEDLEQASELDNQNSRIPAQLGFILRERAKFEKAKFDADMDEVVADYESAIDAFDKYFTIEGDKTPEEYDEIADPEFIKPEQVYVFSCDGQDRQG